MTGGIRVTWFVSSLGYGSRLLYWQPILERFVAAFPQTEILTTETESMVQRTEVAVRRMRRCVDLQIAGRRARIVLPTAVIELIETRPDVVIVSEFGLLSLYAALLRSLFRGVKLLLLVENDPIFLKGYGLERRTYWHRAIRRIIAKRADRILCNTDAAACYVMSDLAVPSEKIELGCYLTSAIDVTAEQRSARVGGLRLLFVGQLVPRKGVSYLIEAVRLARESTRRPILLDIVGDGPQRSSLEEDVRGQGLDGAVVFHGQQPYEELGRFFARADAFVLPTVGDYRALAGFEALSAGCAIIGSIFDGAHEETIKEGVNGFVVDPRDTRVLARRIVALAESPEHCRAFGEESVRMAVAYGPAAAAARLVTACGHTHVARS